MILYYIEICNDLNERDNICCWFALILLLNQDPESLINQSLLSPSSSIILLIGWCRSNVISQWPLSQQVFYIQYFINKGQILLHYFLGGLCCSFWGILNDFSPMSVIQQNLQYIFNTKKNNCIFSVCFFKNKSLKLGPLNPFLRCFWTNKNIFFSP